MSIIGAIVGLLGYILGWKLFFVIEDIRQKKRAAIARNERPAVFVSGEAVFPLSVKKKRVRAE